MQALRAMMASAALAAGLVGGTPAVAQTEDTVLLRSQDGFTQLRGRLVEFDGEVYTLDTVLGVIKVDALQVTCEGASCPELELFGAEFGVYGSNTIGAQLMPALIEGYADEIDATLVTEVGQSPVERTLRLIHEDGREIAAIDLRSPGTSASFEGLASGQADVGMASRRLRDADLPVLTTADIGDLRATPNEHVVGVDGLIVVTHPSNPIKSISLEEMALIFSGNVQNWSQLGGANAPISLYVRDAESGTYQTFEELVLSPYEIGLADNARRFTSNVRLSDSVAADPNGIGVTPVAFQRATKSLPIRQECGILSFPTTFSMKSEEYPLARRLYLYDTPDGASAHASSLIEFAMSDAAQPLIAEAGFVNREVERISINDEGARLIHALVGEEEVSLNLLRDMLTELRDASRLSRTFRFTPGSSQLTPQSQADALRFATELANGDYNGFDVLLVGFTDSIGQFGVNEGLSRRRASVVLDQLRVSVPTGALSDVSVSVLGYGELMPVGCNTTLQGRTVNRRVEVWVRPRS